MNADIEIGTTLWDTEVSVNEADEPLQLEVIDIHIDEDNVTNLVLEEKWPHKSPRVSVTSGDVIDRIEKGELFADADVIDERDVNREAYEIGYNRYKGGYVMTDEELENTDLDLSGSAEFANSIAPHLRYLAGYQDGGHGTYQKPRMILAFDPTRSDPWPERMKDSSYYLNDDLHESWRNGVYDALTGKDPRPNEL